MLACNHGAEKGLLGAIFSSRARAFFLVCNNPPGVYAERGSDPGFRAFFGVKKSLPDRMGNGEGRKGGRKGLYGGLFDRARVFFEKHFEQFVLIAFFDFLALFTGSVEHGALFIGERDRIDLSPRDHFTREK